MARCRAQALQILAKSASAGVVAALGPAQKALDGFAAEGIGLGPCQGGGRAVGTNNAPLFVHKHEHHRGVFVYGRKLCLCGLVARIRPVAVAC